MSLRWSWHRTTIQERESKGVAKDTRVWKSKAGLLRKESWLEGSSSMDIMSVVVEVDVNEGEMMVAKES